MSKKSLKISRRKNLVRFFLFLCVGLVVIMTMVVFSEKSFAQEDLTFSEKANQKKYVGGADESDLKVLATLPSVKNKKTKTEEAEEGF